MTAIHDKALEEAMRLEVRVRPHVTTKVVFGKKVEKSFGQDFVDLKGDDGLWRHIGYYSYSAKFFSGLTGWDNSLNEPVCKELEKIKGFPVSYSGAPPLEEPELEEDEDYDES